MTLDQLTNILLLVMLIEMMVAIGLSVTVAELARVAANWRLVAQATLANYVCVPTIAVGLLLLFASPPLVIAGFLILAVCPGAPFAPPCTALAKGNVPVAVGLMVILAGSSALLAPLLLNGLLPLLAGGAALEIDAGRMVSTLLLTQLLPLGAGLGVHHWWPNLAERLQKPANLISSILSLLAFGLILVVQGHVLAEIRWSGYLGMLTLLLASLGAGWLLGGPGSENRKAVALTTSLRNVGVGLVVATVAFPQTQAVTAVVAYGIFEIVGSLLLALWWGRSQGNRISNVLEPPALGDVNL